MQRTDEGFEAGQSYGQTVVTGSWDNTAKIWDASSGECLQTLEGYNGWVYSIVFSPAISGRGGNFAVGCFGHMSLEYGRP